MYTYNNRNPFQLFSSLESLKKGKISTSPYNNMVQNATWYTYCTITFRAKLGIKNKSFGLVYCM